MTKTMIKKSLRAYISRNEKIPVMWISLEYDDKTN